MFIYIYITGGIRWYNNPINGDVAYLTGYNNPINGEHPYIADGIRWYKLSHFGSEMHLCRRLLQPPRRLLQNNGKA